MVLPSALQFGKEAPPRSPVCARYPNDVPGTGVTGTESDVCCVCVLSVSIQSRFPGSLSSVFQGVVRSAGASCDATIAIRSPVVQCAGENASGPAHGYCTKVFEPEQVLDVPGVVQLYPR